MSGRALHTTNRAASADERREAILAAALELFSERGFHGTAVPLVADKAGVGAGTLYRYFESKEALVNALYQRWKGEFAAHVMTNFPVDAPTRQQFATIWQRMTRFGHQNPRVLQFLELHHHGDYLDEQSRAVERSVLDPVVAFIQDAQHKQAIKPAPVEVIIALVHGAFVGLLRAVQEKRLVLTDEVLKLAEECVWEAVRR